MSAGLNNASYIAGIFAPVSDEARITELKVIGELPRELHGAYLQNSPNPRYPPKGRYHWFDGDGMVHGVYLQDGKASYTNKYVRTQDLAREEEAGQALWGGLMDPIAETPRGPDKDTANTDLEWHAGKLYALWWLGGEPYELSVSDLATKGVPAWAKDMPCGIASHPKVDRQTNEMMFFDYSPYGAPYMHYGVLDAKGEKAMVQPIEIPGPRLFHDIAITENYTLLLDLPMLWRADKVAQGKRAVAFDNNLASRIGVIPRHGGDVRWFEAPPCYIYHTVNAWEEGREIVMWACRIEDPLPKVPHAQEPEIPRLYFLSMTPTLHEWRLNLDTGAVTERQVDDVLTEFPRINDQLLGRKNRYSYNPRLAKQPTLLFDGVVKYDLERETSQTWELEAGHFTSEPTFAPRPGAVDEDDGWLTSLVQDSREGTTELRVTHAQTLETVARVLLPRRVPVGFHACWVPGNELPA